MCWGYDELQEQALRSVEGSLTRGLPAIADAGRAGDVASSEIGAVAERAQGIIKFAQILLRWDETEQKLILHLTDELKLQQQDATVTYPSAELI